MRTKKLRVAAFALSLGLLVGDFGGISQIHAAEVSDPFLGNDYWMGNDPMFGENQINNPVDVPPVNDIIYTKEIIEGDSHQISLFNIPGFNIIWLSSNTDVAIVTLDGNVIGLSEGETIITAIYDGSEYRYLIKVRSSSKTDLSKWIEKKGRYYYHNPYGKKTFYFDK